MQRFSQSPRARSQQPRPLFMSVWAIACALLVAGCATYRDDLDRAITHYHANEYEKSLALLEVLEPDLDSLSPAERARYAYYRGMSDFRLQQRRHARHWLGVSAAREKATPGSLAGEENKRATDTLAELNKDRWGGASTPVADEEACTLDADCAKGQFCDSGGCKDSPLDKANPGAEGTPAPQGDQATHPTGTN